MVNVQCSCGTYMELLEEDDRTEWYRAIYECPRCQKAKEHHQYRDQNGLVTSDTLSDIK